MRPQVSRAIIQPLIGVPPPVCSSAARPNQPGRPFYMAAKKRKRRSTAARPPRAPARPSEPLTTEQANRYTFMRTANPPTDQKRIADALIAQGVEITRQSVGLVIRNNFVNDAVIAEFCKQTGKTREEAWPDVPARADATIATPASTEPESGTIEPETAERDATP